MLGAAALGEKYAAAEVLHHVHQAHGGLGAHEAPPMLQLRLKHFDDTRGAPSQVVSRMALDAVRDGADYLYQLNDDTILVSKGWPETLIGALAGSDLRPNLGVAGPLDTNNARILTHAFVHRTHVELFGCFFPVAFKNWWSDDWISAVYGSSATFARRDVVVTHNVQSQKLGAFNRRVARDRARPAPSSARARPRARARARLRAREPRARAGTTSTTRRSTRSTPSCGAGT